MAQILKNIVHFLMLSCKEATFLIEKKLNDKLTFREKVQLKIHLVICKHCIAYNKKAIYLHKVLQRFFLKKEAELAEKLPNNETFKQKIKEQLVKK